MLITGAGLALGGAGIYLAHRFANQPLPADAGVSISFYRSMASDVYALLSHLSHSLKFQIKPHR